MGTCIRKPSKSVPKYPTQEEPSPRQRAHRHRYQSAAKKIVINKQPGVSLQECGRDSGSFSSLSDSVSSLENSYNVVNKNESHEMHPIPPLPVRHSPSLPPPLPSRSRPPAPWLPRREQQLDSHAGMSSAAALTDTDTESVSSTSSEFDSTLASHPNGDTLPEANQDGMVSCGTQPNGVTPRKSHRKHKRTLVHDSDIPILLEVLANDAYKWREIAIMLGFPPNELHVIESKPHLSANAPNSWLAEMLSRWVKWTPQTKHAKHPTLRDLLKALRSRTVGLAAVAEEVKKEIKGAAKRKTSEDSVDGVTVTRELKPPDSSASVLEHYAYYLRLYFTCNREPADKWPEIEIKEYIRLAVVGSEYNDRADLKEFREATIHGSIDDILKSKAPFDFSDLLKPNFIKGKRHPIRRILLEGAPGIGKSTMSFEVCRKWGNGELFQEYSLVIMLRFRDSWVQKVKSLSDLFRFPGEPEMQQEVAKQIKRTQGKGVLFVLEGFDEAPPSLRVTDSLFFELFRGTLLPNATVMVTTRPSASYDLQKCCKGESSRRIEVLGFGKKEIREYVEAHFSQGPQQVEDFYKYLKLYPHIYSMMYVPLNSAIVTHVYQMCKSTSTLVPQTMTQLYTALVKTLLLRYMKDREEYKYVQISDFNDLPQPILERFLQVCILAYDGITKPEKEIIFSGLPTDFDSLGLMQSVSELYIDKGSSVSHNFLHLTIQEFLAAYYLSTLSEDEQVTFLEENFCSQPQMNKFLAGLCVQNPTPLCKCLEKKMSLYKNVKWKIDITELHMLFELHDPHVVASVFESQNPLFYDEINDIYYEYTLFDFYVLSYIILVSDCKWTIASLATLDNSLFFEALSMHQPLTDQSGNEYGPGAHITELESGLRCDKLVERLDLFPNLQLLHLVLFSLEGHCNAQLLNYCLHNPQITLVSDYMSACGEEQCRALGDILACPRHNIHQVNIKQSEASANCVQLVADGISRNPISSLKRLYIDGSTLSSSNIASLAALLEVNTTLTTLDISRCDLGSHGIICLAKSMEKNTALKSLNLSETLKQCIESNSPHSNGSSESLSPSAHVNALHCMLLKNKGLTNLNLSRCELHSQDVVLLAEALKINSTLESLNLEHNSIDNEGARALAEALKINSTLESLNLEHNSIDNEGARALAEALKINSTLTFLNLEHNSSSDEGATALAEALKINSTLESLNLGHNSISNEGFAALLEALKHNWTLEKLYLQGNPAGTSDEDDHDLVAMASLLTDTIYRASWSLFTMNGATLYVDDVLEYKIEHVLKSSREVGDQNISLPLPQGPPRQRLPISSYSDSDQASDQDYTDYSDIDT